MNQPDSPTSSLTIRAVIISVSLSLFLLASSTYIALKLGALPWPIIFAVIVSGGLIKIFSRGKAVDINEVNIAQAGASIGGLISAGIAFTIPGIIYLNQARSIEIDWPNPWLLALLTVVAGLLGILLSMPLKRIFVDQEALPYPAGTAGAELLKLGKAGGKQLWAIVVVGALAALFAIYRDAFFSAGFPLSFLAAAGIFVTIFPLPMAIGSGYILGPRASFSWMAGAIIGWIVIVPLLIHQAAFEVGAATEWVQNLGMGIVLGSGIGFFINYIAPRFGQIFKPLIATRDGFMKVLPISIVLSLIALILVNVPIWAAICTIFSVLILVAVAARMTGETNINPLEQFGIFTGLILAFVAGVLSLDLNMYALFMIVTFVSVACAVAGDAGHDFKSAVLVGTPFKDIIRIDLISVVFAGLAAPLVLEAIRSGFADQLFTDAMPAPQAKLVAGSIFGFAYPNVFLAGFLLAFFGEIVNGRLPEAWRDKLMIMPMGIGLFLGMAFALPIMVGAILRVYVDKNYPAHYLTGLLVAAGLMGGEGIAGFSNGALVSAGYAATASLWGLSTFFSVVLLTGIWGYLRRR